LDNDVEIFIFSPGCTKIRVLNSEGTASHRYADFTDYRVLGTIDERGTRLARQIAG
jgi:hypothetical protein